MSDADQIYLRHPRQLAEHRKRLASTPAEAFEAYSQSVLAKGAIPAKTKLKEGKVAFIYAAHDEEHNGAMALQEFIEQRGKE